MSAISSSPQSKVLCVDFLFQLMAPLYVILNGDEVSVFWCFVEFMERMVSTFSLCVSWAIGSLPPHLPSHRNQTSFATNPE